MRSAAAILGLEPLLGRYPRQLSGGQRQRVAMGRAIVRKPKVFLFDEPLSNLDAKLRVQMRGEIKELQQRLGTTTIYVTHDQVEAMTMADKIVVMNAGRIEQIGPPLELYDRPANMFVAGFLGSPAMNLLEGTLRLEGGPTLVLEDGIALTLRRAPAGTDGRRVILGVRPEDVLLDAAEGTPARIAVVEPTGSDTFVVTKVKERENRLPGARAAAAAPGPAGVALDGRRGLPLLRPGDRTAHLTGCGHVPAVKLAITAAPAARAPGAAGRGIPARQRAAASSRA